jgi:hypothetical protein
MHLNMTAVPVDGTGNFKAFPGHVGAPNASFVNYREGVQIFVPGNLRVWTIAAMLSYLRSDVSLFSHNDGFVKNLDS